MAAPFQRPHWQQPDRGSLRRDGEHLATLAHWAEQQKRPDLLLPIAAALRGYYDTTGRWRDLLDLDIKSIEYARLLGHHHVLRSELNSLAWLIGQQGRYDEAAQALAEAHTLAVADGDLAWQAEILVNLAQLARRMGRFDQARAYCAEALALLDTIDAEQRPYVQADIAIEQGKIARDLGDWQRALVHFQAAREVFRVDLDQPQFNIERAWGAYSQFAYVTHQLGNLDAAARMYHTSLAAIREVGSRGYLATVLVRYAALEEQRGNAAVALEYAHEALDWSRKLGLPHEQAQAEALLARLSGAAGGAQ
jgi:tetratricopeptide (TPR) repeat protein